ncbi:hypothetical protein Clacol_009785 [Clathrus columnatus]|uniref:NOT2/NOT3/NOT5 C-terminal domain-containing protein n=1 Tax=Clathrus columnatus TaxID=1419009 RepID=A0AAV5AP08_9AGAM|nr:hypothetical protein Clacol_009785 [Clathrus columnatus]
MNRPGQQPQRPPNLGPTTNMGSFRGPFQQTYGLPPRGVIQGYPPMQNHRAQGLVMQPSPGFIQRGSVGSNTGNAFNFAGNLQQQQPQATTQQSVPAHHHSQQPTSSLQQQPPPHPPQPSQTQTQSLLSVPPHLAQHGSSSGNAPNSNDAALDPNDFPALGFSSTPNVTSASAGTTSLHSSYATQAAPSSQNIVNGGQSVQAARDFSPDDFPALGGPTQAQQQHQGTPHSQDSSTVSQQQQQQQPPQSLQQHPPGLNGFQNSDQSQAHRQSLLTGSLQLQQQRNVLGGTTVSNYDVDKRSNFSKSNNQNQNWPTGNTPTSTFPSNQGLSNGAQQHIMPQSQLPSQSATQQQLNASSVPAPSSTYGHQQQQSYVKPPEAHHPHTQQQSSSQAAPQSSQHPQTPAQQLLMSPADRWGLLGLLALIKNADSDSALLGIGADLSNLGLNVGQSGNIYSNFITPWSESSAAVGVEPEFHLPACYNVQPAPPGPSKVVAFSDETLFFMFYSSPRDAIQEVAAQELWNRNWRWHKTLKHWLTKETGTPPSQKVQGGEAGTYTFWDPESWSKDRKELTVLYADLEEKSVPAFIPGPGLQPATINVGGMQNNLAPTGSLNALRQQQSYSGMNVVAGMA